MKRKLNIKVFLWLLAGTMGFGIVFHGVHHLQARNTSSGLLRLAREAKEKNDLNKAANYLQRYLKFMPESDEALIDLGLILDEQALTNPRTRERAFFVLDQVLRRKPDRADVRLKAVRLAMSLRAFADAKAHLEVLKAAAPTDGELFDLLGRCEVGRAKFLDAVKALEKAIQYPPKEVASYQLLANVLWRKRDDAKRADEIMAQMVKEKNSVSAYLARAAYLRERSKSEPAVAEQEALLKRAGEDIAAARRLAPDNVDVLLESAEWWFAQSKPGLDNAPAFEKARIYVEQGLKAHPEEPRLYLQMSRLERLAGRPDEAIDSLHRGLKKVPAENQAELLFTLADLSIDQNSLREVADLLARLRRAQFASAPMAFLDAFAQVKKNEWLVATRALEAIRPLLADWPQLNTRAEFLLGQCYEQLGDPDQQYAAYRRALTADPLSMPAMVGMGNALVAMGRPDDAIEGYRRLAARMPEAKLTVARLLVQRNLGLPKSQQVWDEVDALLKELETALQVTPAPQGAAALLSECYLLRAEATAARGDLGATREILLEAREKQPDSVDMWIALANLAIHQGGMEEAQAIIDKAEKKFGDRVEIRLARAWQIRRGGKDAQALVRLTEGIGDFKEIDQIRLLRECAKGCAALGDIDRAERLFRRLETKRPHDLTIQLTLFDLALETDNHHAANALIANMRKIEVAPGTRWRYATANQIIWRALKGSNSERLEEARALLNALATERPSWYRVAASQGQLSELLGKRDAAIVQYLQAFDLGDRSPAFIQRLCKLLYQAQRYGDAARIMHKLPEGAVIQGDMRQMAVDLSLRSQDYEQALALAEKAVKEKSKDYRNYLWLAQVYVSMNKQAQAEPVLREAVALASDVPETWVILVQYLSFTDQKEKAAAETAKAAKALSTKQAPLALAQCYVAMGNRDQAQLHFQKALAVQPEDIPTLQGTADFYLRTGQLKEADRYLRQIIALKHKNPEAAAAAQRILAQAVLILGGENYEKSRDTMIQLGMLDDTGKTVQPGDESIEQLRAKAITLALLKHRPDRLAAIRVLLQMRARQPLAANDQFLLAQLYESVGNWDKAHVELLALVDKDGKNFSYLTRLALGLLRNGQADAVPPLLSKLKNSYPKTGAVAEISARLLHSQGQATQAAQVLREYTEENEDKLAVVSALLEELRQMEAAEKLLRQFVTRSKAPENCLVLARYLGRQGRLDEALDICQMAAPTCRPEAIAAASLHILYSAKPQPTRDQSQRVEKLLKAFIQKERKVALLDYLGAYHNLQRNFPEAEVAFRAALVLDADDPTALNNLSWLLAFQPQKNSEALQLVQHAIKIMGPYAGVLDTRGVIHLAAGRTDEAVRDLEDVVAEGPTASHYFHLAQAHQQAKNRVRAMTALTEANQLGLNESALHPLERAAYQQLCAQLGIEKK